MSERKLARVVLSLFLQLCVLALLVSASAVVCSAATPGSADLGANVRALNNRVLGLHAQAQQASGESGQSVLRTQAVAALQQRAAALSKLIQNDPQQALALAFSPEALAELAARFPDSAALLEAHATLSGPIERWIWDSADLKSHRTQVLIKIGQSRSVELHFAGPGESALSSGDVVEASGVLVGSTMVVSSSTVHHVATDGTAR